MSNNGERNSEKAASPLIDRLPGFDRALTIPALGLFLGAIILYFITRTRYNTFDAVSYSNQVEHLYPRSHDAHWLFHPHHLLFNAGAYVVWSALYGMGYRGGALRIIQDLNMLWGATGVTLYYLVLRLYLQRSRWLPMLVSIGLSVCFGYWISATDARVNMPSTTLLIAAFYVLSHHLQMASIKLAITTGLLAGLAVLFHESAGIFFPVGLIGLLLPEFDGTTSFKDGLKPRITYAAGYAITWIATVTIPYFSVAAFALHLASFSEFRHWMTSYSELGWWWSFDVLSNIRLDAYALRRAAFVEPAGKQGTFHLYKNAPLAISSVYFAALAGWFVAVYAFVVALPLLWRMRYAKVLVIALVWVAFYTVFFTFWSPGYFIFWVPALVPIGLLITLCLAHHRARQGGLAVNWAVGVWIVLVAIVNLVSSVIPHLKESSDPFQRIAGDVAAHTKTGDIVVVTGAGNAAQCEVDIPYFADRDVVSLHGILTRQHNNPDAAIAAARQEIDTAIAEGHNVYALDEVWHDPIALASLERHHPGWNASDVTTLFQPYHLTHAWHGPHGVVWKLLPSAISTVPS
jgi:hypothetical protein